MRHLIIILIIFIVAGLNMFSQNKIDSVLTEIEMNNISLLALRRSAEAEKIGNKTGIYLQNPEIEFNYLWGNPAVIGNRTDMSVMQTFDFPTAYGLRNQISNIRNEQVELAYQSQRNALLLRSRIVCFDLVYANALKSEISKRLVHARMIANSYQSKFELGESSILEYNKAQLNLLNLSKALESIFIERDALLSELTRLNGGIFIDFTDSVFQTPAIPDDFNKWYELAEIGNPNLRWLKQEIEVNKKQEKLNRALSLPKFQTGYMSEKVVGEQFQGITVGLSIPLWENKNTVKYIKAHARALEITMNDNGMQLYNQLKALHTKATGLQKNANDYRLRLHSFDNSELLRKAYDKNEISLIEYILELSIYYESIDKLLELEKELNKTLAELNQYM